MLRRRQRRLVLGAKTSQLAGRFVYSSNLRNTEHAWTEWSTWRYLHGPEARALSGPYIASSSSVQMNDATSFVLFFMKTFHLRKKMEHARLGQGTGKVVPFANDDDAAQG